MLVITWVFLFWWRVRKSGNTASSEPVVNGTATANASVNETTTTPVANETTTEPKPVENVTTVPEPGKSLLIILVIINKWGFILHPYLKDGLCKDYRNRLRRKMTRLSMHIMHHLRHILKYPALKRRAVYAGGQGLWIKN